MIEKLRAHEKAYRLFRDWLHEEFYMLPEGKQLIDLSGYLYRFLDEKGIHVNVVCLSTYTTYPEYAYEILLYSDGERESEYNNERNFNSRQEAEEAAFVKGFEILNERIKT